MKFEAINANFRGNSAQVCLCMDKGKYLQCIVNRGYEESAHFCTRTLRMGFLFPCDLRRLQKVTV